MGRISDILSKREPAKFSILGIEVKFGLIDLCVLQKYEERGISLLDDASERSRKFPISFGTELAWELMLPESKEDFDNDYKTFLKALSPSDVQKIMNIVSQAFIDSMPAENSKKNEEEV